MASFLSNFGRQPKIYIDLPSKGKYYNSSIIKDEKYTEIPVFGMNTMDELMLKTPDALFSGESTASIIQSCIPHILDPWKIVGFDTDSLLIAIRIATSGEMLDLSTKCSHCGTEADYSTNIIPWLDYFKTKKTTYEKNINGLQVILQPLTYKKSTEHAKEIFKIHKELQKIRLTAQENESDSRLNMLNKLLANLNLEITISHIQAISNSEEIENNVSVITEFLKNTESNFYKELLEAVNEMNENWEIPPVNLSCSNPECGKTFSKKVNMDYSNFFVKIS